MYLNQFDFLHNAVGIENAAKVYFNKKPIDLTKSEAAMLVGMCKNPSLYNPYTYQIKNYRPAASKKFNVTRKNVTDSQIQTLRSEDSTRAHERRNQVLFQWKRNTINDNKSLKNKMKQAEYDSLIKKSCKTDYQVVDHRQGIAPYFRESLRGDLSVLFKTKNSDGSYKYAKQDGTPYNVYKDGLKIYTTINAAMQQHAENAVQKHLKKNLQPAFEKNNRKLRNFPFTNRISNKVAETLMNSGRKQSERWRKMRLAGMNDDDILKSFDFPIPMRIFSWEGETDTVMTPND